MEEKEKALEDAREEAGREINKYRRENKRLQDVIIKMSPGGEAGTDKAVQTEEEVETEETPGAEVMEENDETAGTTVADHELNREGKPGLVDKIKTMFRK